MKIEITKEEFKTIMCGLYHIEDKKGNSEQLRNDAHNLLCRLLETYKICGACFHRMHINKPCKIKRCYCHQ